MVDTILFLVTAYLIGAIPFGLLIGKIFYKTDIRQHGSKNPGATNVWRTLGKWPGMVTLLLDMLKGFVPVFLILQLFALSGPLAIVVGALTIIGHNWSIFLMGKGGKGVATSAGVFLALIPKQMGLSLITFVIFLLATKHVSVGSMAAAIVLYVATFFISTDPVIQGLVLVAAAMILIKHVPNMKRLKRGEEPKVKFR